MSIMRVSGVYNALEKISIEFIDIDSTSIRNFSRELDSFTKRIGDAGKDEYWRRNLFKLKRLRFDICSAPIGFKDLHTMINSVLKEVSIDDFECESLYPSFSGPYTELLDNLEGLLNIGYENFFGGNGEVISNKIIVAGLSGLLIKEPRLLPLVDTYIFKHLDYSPEAITPADLGHELVYDSIVVFGPPRWFPDYIFSSPRAITMSVLQYSWAFSSWKFEPQLPNSFFHSQFKHSTEYNLRYREPSPEDYTIEIPTIDVSGVLINIESEISSNPDQEMVESKLYYLQDDAVVFLDFDKNSGVQVLVPQDLKNPVKKIRVRELIIGSYILLRTGGGGDYIVPIANEIMDKSLGITSSEARGLQQKWKDLLRQEVNNIGYEGVVNKLESNGSLIASKMNVRNWMSYRTIKTQKYEDFFAIMKFLGMDKDAKHIWKVMKIINASHHQAGMHIRKILIDEIKKTNLDTLIRKGVQTFSMEGESTTGMTAYRIIGLSEELYKVPSTKIGELERLD